MTSSLTHGPTSRGTATIYQFPVGGRAGLNTFGQHRADQTKPVYADFAAIDAWYHQDAIREAQQAT